MLRAWVDVSRRNPYPTQREGPIHKLINIPEPVWYAPHSDGLGLCEVVLPSGRILKLFDMVPEYVPESSMSLFAG